MDLQQAMFLLEDHENNDVAVRIINDLLSSISPTESEHQLRSIAHFVRDVSLVNPNVCHSLLVHLETVPNALPFLEVIPSIFAVAPTDVVKSAAKQLLRLLASRCELFAPCIGALMELPLSNEVKPLFSKIMENALKTADMSSLPILLNILFKSMDAMDAPRMLLMLRHKVFFMKDS
jgi:hypothetical protein